MSFEIEEEAEIHLAHEALSYFSLSTAVLLLTSFCFGAGVFSLILDLCPNNELPNFLASYQIPSLCDGFKCPQCKKLNCNLHKHALEQWKFLEIPKEIDKALTELYEHILQEHIYQWYGHISYDEEFVQEIRHLLRHATSVLIRRLGKVNLSTLITRKAIPVVLSHFDTYLLAKEYSSTFQTPVREAYFDLVGIDIHPAAHNREREVLYVQNAAAKLLPVLASKKTLQHGAVRVLLRDLLSGVVLQPLLDTIADPDVVNFLIELSFNDDPMRHFPSPSGDTAELLADFVSVKRAQTSSSLHMDLSAILKNQQALFAFMQFLKEEGGINYLQFCLSIEDFNKRMMTPELRAEELKDLHKEANELYNLYFKRGASHKVDVSPELVQEIFTILSGPFMNVSQLRTSTPLFKAYEEVYNKLEALCPAFHRSEQYFLFLLGRRVSEVPESLDRQHSRVKSDLGARATEKLGKGLRQIKQEVMGKSLEGIADPLDHAFDVADYCEEEAEETSSSLNGSLTDILEYKDLATWRVSIPRVMAKSDGSRKSYFVFVVEVRRSHSDSTGRKGDREADPLWVVERRYSEFYVLESKLTIFHGEIEFEDLRLPARGNFFTGQGLDVMQSKQQAFEDYLRRLLQKSSLHRSDILFTFLTSPDEFTMAASNLGIGKMIKSMPMKLAKERGQSLAPFIKSFMDSTQSEPSKPRSDYVSSAEEHDGITDRPIVPHALFRDNLGVVGTIKLGHCNKLYNKLPTRQDSGAFDALVYFAIKVFKLPSYKCQFLMATRILLKASIDHWVEYALASKLAQVLSVGRMTHLCKLLENVIFESSSSRTEYDKVLRRDQAYECFSSVISSLVSKHVDAERLQEGTKLVFQSLQDPIINKQLAFVLLDTVMEELFPELFETSSHSTK